ncbi:MAG: peroxidase-related enzyme [Minwuiales bacterium]|nr:peroxidase-related enzyme [Minwuiales bacterium]
MPFLDYAKDFQGVADVFLRDPARYGPLLHFIEDVMTRESELSKSDREIIAARVSRLNGCDFCLGAHKWTLAAMDVDPALIAAAADAEDGPVEPKLGAVLAFADKMTETPGAIGAGDIDALLAVGWSEQAVEDAINVVALFNYVNRLVDGFGIQGSTDYFRHIGTALAKHGYAPLIASAEKRAN